MRPAQERPALVYLARLSDGSRRTMRGALDGIARLLSDGCCDAETLDWAALRYQHTAAVRSALQSTVSPRTGAPLSVATVNKLLAALRGVLREAWRLGLLSAEDFHRAIDLPNVRGQALPRGRALTTGEVRALLDACVADTTTAGARDAAVIAVLYGAGLRRSELVALNVDDYDAAGASLAVRAGKGRKQRVVYIAAGGAAAVETWLRLRGDASGALFWATDRGGRPVHRRLSSHAVMFVLRRRALRAGVVQFSAHDMRRTFISHLLDAGADIATAQALAGHASVTTTATYDRRGERTKQAAAALLNVPFAAQT
jgi:site-specific recombinase XerD